VNSDQPSATIKIVKALIQEIQRVNALVLVVDLNRLSVDRRDPNIRPPVSRLL
jgi:hypothetical protein